MDSLDYDMLTDEEIELVYQKSLEEPPTDFFQPTAADAPDPDWFWLYEPKPEEE